MTTLKLDKNFHDAREALKKLDESETKGLRDWFEWWFTGTSGLKKALGAGILVLILVMVAKATYDAISGTEVSNSLFILIGITIVIFLLSSITKLKIGPVELEMQSAGRLTTPI